VKRSIFPAAAFLAILALCTSSAHSPAGEPCLALSALAATAAGQGASQGASRGDGQGDGVPVGVDFDIPLVIAGKSTTGKAFVNAERVLRIYYVADGKVAGPMLYDLVRRGDVPTPPKPPDPPVPPKPPDPPPVLKAAFVYLIHESADATPALAAIRNAAAWKTEAEKLGMKWLIFDKDSGAKKFPSATNRATDVGLPAVVLIDKAGGAIAEKLPATPDAMLSLVRRAGLPAGKAGGGK
jgi:hypothetical protein